MQVSKRSPTLNTGRLRHRVMLVRVSNAQDSMGGQDVNVNTLWTKCWASVEALSGSEKFAAHEFVSEVTHQVVIRFIGYAPSWQADSNYLTSAQIIDNNGNLQQPQGAGLSGATAPTWNPVQGETTFDGDPSTGITWLNLGPAPQRVTGVNSAMQLWADGVQMQIQSVQNPDKRNKMLLLQCLEINDSNQQNPTLTGGGAIG